MDRLLSCGSLLSLQCADAFSLRGLGKWVRSWRRLGDFLIGLWCCFALVGFVSIKFFFGVEMVLPKDLLTVSE